MIAIYARVSTEDQAKLGYSLQDQVRTCKERAGTSQVLEYVDDGISGELLDRPALNRLREDLRAGLIDKVICYDPDRLSRKLQNQLIIAEEIDNKAKLEFVNHDYQNTPEGNMFFMIRGAVAEFEKEKIKERMMRGRREKARQGRVLRDFQVYGYTYDKQTERFTINEQEAAVVRMIFDLFTQPDNKIEGVNGIAKMLTEKGIPTKRGAQVWHRQVVRQILLNRAYIGEFYQNRWNTEGMFKNKHAKNDSEKVRMKERPREEWILIPCPPIITREQFDHAQDMLEASRRRWVKKSKHFYLLGGLLRCPHCGNTMTGRQSKTWGKYNPVYTDRKNTAGAKHPGCGNTIDCDKLDKIVWDWFLSMINDHDQIAAHSEKNSQLRGIDETQRIELEIDRVKKSINRLITLIATDDSIGDMEEVREKLKELKLKEGKLKKNLEIEKKRAISKQRIKYSKNLLGEAVDFYLTNKDDLSDDIKKELLRTVIREIQVYKDGETLDIVTF